MNLRNIKLLLKKLKSPITFRNSILFQISYFLYRKNKGSCIFDFSWDNLIILDACRYDIFKYIFEKRNMKGKLTKIISRGAHTISFLLENFKNSKYNDLIYITANPYVNRYLNKRVYKIISVWKDGWDYQNHTVLPETMYEYVVNAIIKYPKKRFIIHFIQPHFPYIGFNLKDSDEDIRESFLNNVKTKRIKQPFFSIYNGKIYSLIDRKTHIKAYMKNLYFTFPYVEKLIKILPGTTIISADHGESFGEKLHSLIPIKFFGHRRGLRMPVLVNVPMVIIHPNMKNSELIKEELNEKNKIKKIISNIQK